MLCHPHVGNKRGAVEIGGARFRATRRFPKTDLVARFHQNFVRNN